MAWNDLSIAQRSQLINTFRHNGVSSLSEMKRLYDLYSPLEGNIDTYNTHTAPMYAGGGDKGTLNNKRYNSEHERAMYDYLRSGGLNHQQASGLLGNLAVESYLDAEMQQIGGPAYGLMQAEGARKRAMLSYNDKPYLFGSNLSQEEQQQLDYILDKGIDAYTPGEWGKKGFSGARKAREAFVSSSDTREASDIITNNFLRPGKPNISRRRAMSGYFDEKYSNTAPYNMENWYTWQATYSDGGSKIHIKPSHRGKFTALKKRTGHSASWFKAHGTPAQRKMATFELNARKWKHSHGGIKF